ncbi:MAG: electron transfer flavoprotein subunit beta/FixA family protein [Syntrophaceae bacterium]|nr:electron transfer flavoprotein subunit beta/FixA family protein [Syntrophaceae bacterium]
MRIIVCVKPVPDPRHWNRMSLHPTLKVLVREGIPNVVNPLDRHALEEALRIRERYGGEVMILSMAPLFSLSILREALAMGADRAVLLSDKAFAGSDTLATSHILSEAVKRIGPFDLILCGNQTIDGWTGHVGPQLSEFLGIEGISFVKMIEGFHFEEDGTAKAIVRKKTEGGYVRIEARLPLLLSVVKEINTPRYVTFSGILEAERKEIQVMSASDLRIDPSQVGLAGSPTKMADLFMPEVKRRREVVQEKPEMASKLIFEKIRQRGLI